MFCRQQSRDGRFFTLILLAGFAGILTLSSLFAQEESDKAATKTEKESKAKEERKTRQ